MGIHSWFEHVGVFKDRVPGTRLDADIVTGKRLARKIMQANSAMVRGWLEPRRSHEFDTNDASNNLPGFR